MTQTAQLSSDQVAYLIAIRDEPTGVLAANGRVSRPFATRRALFRRHLLTYDARTGRVRLTDHGWVAVEHVAPTGAACFDA